MSEFLKMPMYETSESSRLDIGRPYVHICCNGKNLDCIIDTGANMPIFVAGVNLLKKYFPDAVEIPKYNITIVGFGNDGTFAKAFRIKSLRLDSTDNSDYIVIKDLLVACCDKEGVGADMILSGGLFNNMNLTISTINRYNCNVIIEHDLNVHYGNVTLTKDGNLRRVFVYTQLNPPEYNVI